jgi:hypothetical protein
MIDTINDPKILFPIAIPTISAMLFMLFWIKDKMNTNYEFIKNYEISNNQSDPS